MSVILIPIQIRILPQVSHMLNQKCYNFYSQQCQFTLFYISRHGNKQVSQISIFWTSVADPDPGSGMGCLFDPWIRDPGWEKVSIRIRDPG